MSLGVSLAKSHVGVPRPVVMAAIVYNVAMSSTWLRSSLNSYSATTNAQLLCITFQDLSGPVVY